jgi:hypothetical protein
MPSVIFSWDPVLALLPVVSDSLWGSLALDSYNEFSTQIPEEISLPNFIWEFKEIGSLLPKLEDTLSKTIASGYLNWNFGWKPFLQDLSTLGNLVGTVRAKIAYLKSRFGKPTRLSFYRPNLVSIPFLRDWNDTSTGIYQLRLASYMANFRASGTLYHELEGLDSLDGELRAFTVALGLTNPVKAFWNAVPFSFVVDWFGRLGSRLFQHTVNPYQGLWQVYDLTCSVSETAQVDVRWSYRHDLNGYPHIGHIAVNRYTRLARLPLELSSFNLESLSPKQQMLSLALLRTVTR